MPHPGYVAPLPDAQKKIRDAFIKDSRDKMAAIYEQRLHDTRPKRFTHMPLRGIMRDDERS